MVNEPQPTDAKSERRPFQFSLRGLFWFVTLVGTICASVACATRLWGESGVMSWFTIVFLFWPSFAAVVTWSCPDIPFTVRPVMFSVVSLGAVVFSGGGILWQTGDLGTTLLFAILSACFFWIPQGVVVFEAITYGRERSRIRQSDQRGGNPSSTPPDTP